MGWFSTTRLDSLECLFMEQIKDLYDAEQRLTTALPGAIEAAHNPSLRQALTKHLHETENQVHRLERIFDTMDLDPEAKTCEAMKGLIYEAKEAIDAEGEQHVKDAALIAAAQRIEHYEMAGYGTARELARTLGMAYAVQLLQESLDEEKMADRTLTALAEQEINVQAVLT